MPGRKAKPTAIKVLEGNPGKRALNKNEPRPPMASARVPKGRLPAEGKRLWRALADNLIQLGVLTENDLPAFEMLCLHFAVARDAWEIVKKEGIISETTKGETKKHPAVSVFRENSQMFKAYAIEFGLTPASRVKIHAQPVEKEKTLAELLFSGVQDELDE